MKIPPYPARVILEVAQTVHDVALPHAERLARLGVGPAYFTRFQQEIDATSALTKSTGQRIQLRTRTIEKDEVRETAADWGIDLRLRLEGAFGRRSAEYALFPASFDRARESETVLLELMPALIQLATDHAEALAEEGQTPEDLTEGAQLMEALAAANAAQEAEKALGPGQTRIRYAGLNGLVQQVNRINRVGRRIFRDEPDKLILFQTRWPRRSRSAEDPEDDEDTDAASDPSTLA